MPYKDPERKRQWEREHREQRNAIRRRQRSAAASGQITLANPAPDRTSTERSQTSWTVLASIAVGIGVVLLGVLAGVRIPDHLRSS